MKLYLICVTTYLFTLLIESSTPTWLRVITGISLGILCGSAVADQYLSEKRMKKLEKKIDELQERHGGSKNNADRD